MPLGEICALAAAASWAVGSLLFANIGKRVAPGAMNLGKCFAAAIVLSSIRLFAYPWLGPVKWSGEAAVPLALSGIVGLTIGDTAYFGAIVTLGVPRAILLLSSAPVFATLGGALFLGEKVTFSQGAGIALTLFGIALVVLDKKVPVKSTAASDILEEAAASAASGGIPSVDTPPKGNAEQSVLRPKTKLRKGVELGIIAALGQAAGSLLSRKAMLLGVDALAASAGRIVVGAAGLFVLAKYTDHGKTWISDLRTDRAWLKVAGASLIGTVGGIWLSQLALANTESTGVTATLLATSPIFALPLSHFFGYDKITVRAALGTLLAIGGVVLLSSHLF